MNLFNIRACQVIPLDLAPSSFLILRATSSLCVKKEEEEERKKKGFLFVCLFVLLLAGNLQAINTSQHVPMIDI